MIQYLQAELDVESACCSPTSRTCPYLLNHRIHHRAQLGVYLRLTGIAVPAVYSGAADEEGGMFVPAHDTAATARTD
jgi:uncharacterized damage-inducible protein DinB